MNFPEQRRAEHSPRVVRHLRKAIDASKPPMPTRTEASRPKVALDHQKAQGMAPGLIEIREPGIDPLAVAERDFARSVEEPPVKMPFFRELAPSRSNRRQRRACPSVVGDGFSTAWNLTEGARD